MFFSAVEFPVLFLLLPPPSQRYLLVISNPLGATLAGLPARLGTTLGAALRLWLMCARTKCPAANAEHKDNSPANTPAAMTFANCWELAPGVVG